MVVVLSALAVLGFQGLTADSQRTLGLARRAQAEFERARRWHLPLEAPHGRQDCDARIGRFCYWYDADEPDLPAHPSTPEPPSIASARERLLTKLDSAARLIPGDDWIAGQRVRYLVEVGRTTQALALTSSCRAVPWWCRALAGFARHAAGDFAGAEAAFDDALRLMPEAERCRWTDISVLLDDALRRRYERLPCEERGALEARVWWLARPLYLVGAPGVNDRRTEHFARVVLTRIQRGAATAYGLAWGDDFEELTLRYGWPARWARESRGPLQSAEADVVVGHEPDPSFHFLPAPAAVESPWTATAGAWEVRAPRPLPRERYAPPYARAVTSLPHQVGVFRRGDSALVVAAYDVTDDSVLAHAALRAGLVLAADERTEAARREETPPRGRPRGVFVAAAPWGSLLFDLEVFAPVERRAARARYAVGPPPLPQPCGRASVSDLLLFDPPPPDSLPARLDGVVPVVRGTTRARAGGKIGLFWEVYGLDAGGEVVGLSVTLVRRGGGVFRRLARSLHLAGPGTPVLIEWQEALRGPLAGRALTLDLTGVPPGSYRVELGVRVAGQAPLAAVRDVAIERR